MKIYIALDMEGGTTGVVNWDEVDHQKALFYKQFQKKMTNEVAAACKGAINDAGANEVWVKLILLRKKYFTGLLTKKY